MRISEILIPARIACAIEAKGSEGLLGALAGLLTLSSHPRVRMQVLDGLVARERLGSTALGRGVAIPHARTNRNKQTIAAFVKLKTAIDFDAPDNHPADLFFALLVPEESTEEHLQVLAHLAEMFSDQAFLDRIRAEHSSEAIHKLLGAWPNVSLSHK